LFEGAPLGFWPVLTAHTIAAGGRQGFRMIDHATDEAFDLPFTANVTNPSHQVVALGGDHVVIAATAAGAGHLRIMSPAGELYDRMSIDSEEVASMRTAPVYAAVYPYIDPPRWAGYSGGLVTLSIVLAAADGDWLVDENIAVRAPLALQRVAWDSFSLAPVTAGTMELAVDAGHVVDERLPVTVVDRFDNVEILGPDVTGVGGDIAVCFVAWKDGVGTADRTLVVGVPWLFHVTGPATSLATQRYPSCLELHTTADGPVVVTATVAGQTWTAAVEVRGANARTATGMHEWLWAPTEGDRAAMATE